jgi:hypothetical protein
VKDWSVGSWIEKNYLDEPISPMQSPAMSKAAHECLAVPMLWRQEAALQPRQVKRVWDSDRVVLAVVLRDGELECALSCNC